MDNGKSKPVSEERKSQLPSQPSLCTGCGLCASVCRNGAIRLVENADGFLVAKVDTALCVGCKVCEKMCACLTEVGGHEKHRYYEAWSSRQQVRLSSSSGGVFVELARDCIACGGVVYGVEMQGTDFPRFIAVERVEDLQKLQGSKYLQADTGEVMAQMVVALKSGRPVLFVGVSCQVRAARVRFGEKYPNLLLVDLACFGVPSRHLFRRFTEELNNHAPITQINFRDKSRSWRSYGMRLSFADGGEEFIPKETNPFMHGFLCHLGLNECCYTCRSAVDDRPGDISLGDFWGRPRQEDERAGVSIVISHTVKGEEALERVRPVLHLKSADEKEALSCNGGLVAHAGGVPPQRTAFLNALRRQPLQRVLKHFLMADGRPRYGWSMGSRFIPAPLLIEKVFRKMRRMMHH